MPEKYEREIEELLKKLEHRQPSGGKGRWHQKVDRWLEDRRRAFQRSLARVSAAELALYGFILILASFLLRFVMPSVARLIFLASFLFFMLSFWVLWQRSKAYLIKRLEEGDSTPPTKRFRWDELLRLWLQRGETEKE